MNEMKLLEAIGTIDDRLVANAKNKKHIKMRFSYKKIIAAAAAVLCITALLPAATALGSDGAYSLLYNIAPGIAQTFKPIRRSCEDNGIKMEVVSASVEGSKSSFLISMQGDKIDETADLFDSYYINCPFDSSCGVSLTEFDESTKTAYFLVNIKTMHGEAIKKDKITFGVKNLLLNKQVFSGVIADIDLNDVPENPPAENGNVNYRGFSGVEAEYAETHFRILEEEKKISAPVKGVTITGIGYIDNALHVQVYYDDIHNTDNHGFIFLADENGKKYADDHPVLSFWDKDNKGSYDENIIEIPYNELKKYNLYGEFITSDGYLSGDWELTFKME